MAGGHRKLHFLTILKGFETITLDCTKVDKYVGTAFLLDESVTFGLVEPLYGAINLGHCTYLFYSNNTHSTAAAILVGPYTLFGTKP